MGTAKTSSAMMSESGCQKEAGERRGMSGLACGFLIFFNGTFKPPQATSKHIFFELQQINLEGKKKTNFAVEEHLTSQKPGNQE